MIDFSRIVVSISVVGIEDLDGSATGAGDGIKDGGGVCSSSDDDVRTGRFGGGSTVSDDVG